MLLLAVFNVRADSPSYRKDPDTGIESWELRTRGVRLSLTQILPDQVRAFYAARGFDAASLEPLTTRHCVFQTIFQNESGAAAVRYRLNEWRVQHSGGMARLKLVEDWMPEWECRGVAPYQRRHATQRWPVLGLPTTFILDSQGRIAYRAVGGREWDDPVLLKGIRGLMAEE